VRVVVYGVCACGECLCVGLWFMVCVCACVMCVCGVCSVCVVCVVCEM